ncbi:MAG: ABC transporter ATP-binding protein [Lentisphaeria bacterium]|nr:ABC transporter ATP-binding protein [Lentisphaeria bacterium]
MKENLSPLRAENITFSYMEKAGLFSDLSFALPSGKMTVLAGSNGCGKSTLLRILAGIQKIKRGRVLLKGVPLEHYSIADRTKITGFVPQELPLAENMTVRDLLITGRLAKKNLFGLPIASADDEKEVEKVLRDLELAELAERTCASLSGGEFRRAAIGAILVQQPEILLLDEPCAALDYRHTLELYDILKKMCEEKALTILLVSHDLILPAKYASNFVLMKKGRLIAEGAPEEVLCKENLEKVYDIPFEILSTGISTPVPIPMEKKK